MMLKLQSVSIPYRNTVVPYWTSDWKTCWRKQAMYFFIFILFFCIVYLGQANWSVRTRYAGGVLRSSKGKRQYQSSVFLSRSLSSLSHSVSLSLTPPCVTLSENTHHFPHQLLSRQLLTPIRGTRGLIRVQGQSLTHPRRSTFTRRNMDRKEINPDSPAFPFFFHHI